MAKKAPLVCFVTGPILSAPDYLKSLPNILNKGGAHPLVFTSLQSEGFFAYANVEKVFVILLSLGVVILFLQLARRGVI
jgi:hypothetical protein